MQCSCNQKLLPVFRASVMIYTIILLMTKETRHSTNMISELLFVSDNQIENKIKTMHMSDELPETRE